MQPLPPPMTPPVLGLLSDSHGNAEATRHAAGLLVAGGATHLLHLGDLCAESAVDAMTGWTTPAGAPIPAHLVWGNCDLPTPADIRYAEGLGIAVHAEIGWLIVSGKSIAMTHGHLPRRMHEALTSRANVLLHGHLHRRLDFMEGITRVICAGSVSTPRDGLPPVAALLCPASGQLKWLELG